jgi:hypothetical protein
MPLKICQVHTSGNNRVLHTHYQFYFSDKYPPIIRFGLYQAGDESATIERRDKFEIPLRKKFVTRLLWKKLMIQWTYRLLGFCRGLEQLC